jgi:hypothetical protein
MQTPQNTKTLPNHLVGNSRNIEGTAPTFGLFAPFDHQFVGDSSSAKNHMTLFSIITLFHTIKTTKGKSQPSEGVNNILGGSNFPFHQVLKNMVEIIES